MIRDLATQRQIDAADPNRSTWLSANAGSGKTRVLTDRVARLLYEGVSPQNILCLTYTKAAASEMQNRLFEKLGSWTSLPPKALERELRALGVEGDLTDKRLRDARTLFARAIDAPGGLKIQTIHSFCAMLLRRFPLEAGVTLQFKELDDVATTQLRQRVFEDMAEDNDARIIDALAQYQGEHGLDDILAAIVRKKALFQWEFSLEEIEKAHGAGPSEAEIVAHAVDPSALKLCQDLAEVLGQHQQAMDVQLRERLRPLTETDDPATAFAALTNVFLTKDKKGFRAKLLRKDVREGDAAHLVDDFDRLAEDFATWLDALKARRATDRSVALLTFGRVFVDRYEGAKARSGWLDFDDLIGRAQSLLSDPKVAAWVLYRLDGGVDHLLVDEAQDTSPAQWNVIERLTEDIGVGIGANEAARSIFVVGDKKQSIYSFQGADPTGFDRMRDRFDTRLNAVDDPLQKLELEHSFRSSSAILETVDATFSGHHKGLGQVSNHLAFKSHLPGRVDLWPVIERQPAPEKDVWYDPVDRTSPESAVARLAKTVAQDIERLVDTEHRPIQNKDGEIRLQRVRPGDILVLLPRRSSLFHEIILACKQLGLPMAGSDQVRLGAEIAVRDLTSLFNFLSLAEDDLALAETLKSPLCGWDEQALYTLAHGRPGHLWEALRGSDHAETLEFLNDLRARAEFLRPYELLERVLVDHNGRAKLLARLGEEAEEGIDLLLNQALAYEQNEVPTLSGFLAWIASADFKVKRTIDSSRDEIRVMTIHGSKGLESPIVYLPALAKRDAPKADAILDGDAGAQWTVGRKEDRPAAQSALVDALAAQERDEDQRLLYVAMTRAEVWLICAAAGNVGKTPMDSWYAQVEAGLQATSAETETFLTGEGLRYEPLSWDHPIEEEAQGNTNQDAALPSWAMHPVQTLPPQDAPISPSTLPGAKALPGEAGRDTDEAMAWGTELHRLLEVLPNHPRDTWPKLAPSAELLAAAEKVLDADALAPVFAPDAFAEVDIAATLKGQKILGTIDRLIVSDTKVQAIDFKSNRVVPKTANDVPAGVLAQMGAYASALSDIYPDRQIETAIVWTETASFMPLPHDLVIDALQTAMSS